MHLTPAILEATYELLRTMPPFRGWGLPPGDEIEFHVTRHLEKNGDYNRYIGTDNHIIRISDRTIGQIDRLLRTMAHEVVHLKQAISKTETPNTVHNSEFHRLWARVCRAHGFDLKEFF